jgi:hypothetical protein
MPPFDADYFERGEALGLSLYTDYRWLPELTIPLAHELVTTLGIGRDKTILDFGCAKGFLVKALRLLHYEAHGFDISDYALAAAPTEIRPYLHKQMRWDSPFSWTIAKDVLEHIPYDHIDAVLSAIRANTDCAFAIVPLGDGYRYNAPDYERDVTHFIREGYAWWGDHFADAGFEVTDISTDMPFIKRKRCTMSDAFFTLRSRR